jgi:phage baseplate assembly protein W
MSKAISLPFSFDVNGAVASTLDQKKIIQDRIVLAMMTYTSERVMRPRYGTHIKGSVFENISAASSLIQQEVSAGFSDWFPYLTLLNTDVKLDPIDGHLNIVINYKYGSSANPETVSIKTDILSQSGDVITEVPYGNQ